MGARSHYQEQGNARGYLLRIADRLACDDNRRTKPAANLNAESWKANEPAGCEEEPSRAAALGEEITRLAERLTNCHPSNGECCCCDIMGSSASTKSPKWSAAR